MNLFTSPLRRRIEKMIAEIYNQRAENAIKRNGITHRAEEYSKLLSEDIRLERDVKILREALRR